jgi:hypothetical protein
MLTRVAGSTTAKWRWRQAFSSVLEPMMTSVAVMIGGIVFSSCRRHGHEQNLSSSACLSSAAPVENPLRPATPIRGNARNDSTHSCAVPLTNFAPGRCPLRRGMRGMTLMKSVVLVLIGVSGSSAATSSARAKGQGRRRHRDRPDLAELSISTSSRSAAIRRQGRIAGIDHPPRACQLEQSVLEEVVGSEDPWGNEYKYVSPARTPRTNHLARADGRAARANKDL